MRFPHARRPGRNGALVALAAAGGLALTGCTQSINTGFLPSRPGVTDKTESIINFWNGSWIALLVVGVIAWGLTLWAIVVYRKRKDDNELPVQLQYHVPLELLYTVIPLVLIGTLFVFSQRTIDHVMALDKNPKNTIEVYGKQWSWDFNYLNEKVYYSGQRVALTGKEGIVKELPVLYLPVGESVEFQVHSRDVQHAFWIPAFLYKTDMIPGRSNVFQITPQEKGSYIGKCAEMCGEFHSEMLFRVEVVDRSRYEAEMKKLREAGNTGRLGEEFNRWRTKDGSK